MAGIKVRALAGVLAAAWALSVCGAEAPETEVGLAIGGGVVPYVNARRFGDADLVVSHWNGRLLVYGICAGGGGNVWDWAPLAVQDAAVEVVPFVGCEWQTVGLRLGVRTFFEVVGNDLFVPLLFGVLRLGPRTGPYLTAGLLNGLPFMSDGAAITVGVGFPGPRWFRPWIGLNVWPDPWPGPQVRVRSDLGAGWALVGSVRGNYANYGDHWGCGFSVALFHSFSAQPTHHMLW